MVAVSSPQNHTTEQIYRQLMDNSVWTHYFHEGDKEFDYEDIYIVIGLSDIYHFCPPETV